jgi:hypothetical protein
MIAAFLAWWRKWDIDKKWPTPEAEGDLANGGKWRVYSLGSWQ